MSPRRVRTVYDAGAPFSDLYMPICEQRFNRSPKMESRELSSLFTSNNTIYQLSEVNFVIT